MRFQSVALPAAADASNVRTSAEDQLTPSVDSWTEEPPSALGSGAAATVTYQIVVGVGGLIPSAIVYDDSLELPGPSWVMVVPAGFWLTMTWPAVWLATLSDTPGAKMLL